jgi:hypothetical protein
MTLKEKCKMVQQCLPESPFRDQFTKLHDEMISLLQEAADRIEALEEALRDIENLQYGLYEVCAAVKIASEALDT